MRKLLLQLIMILLAGTAFAQNPVVTITSPEGLTEPYSLCAGEQLSFSVDTTGIGIWMYDEGWYTCTEMPDFEGWSNQSEWNATYITDHTFDLTLEEDVYVWFVSYVGGGWFGTASYSNVIEITSIGEKPEIVYDTTKFCKGSTVTISATPDDLGDGNYIWYHNGRPVRNGVNAALEISTAGDYEVEAMTSIEECGEVYYKSEAVTFSYFDVELVGDFDNILGQLELTTTEEFATYQWMSSTDGVVWEDIEGETNATYTAAVTTTDTYYSVKVSSEAGCDLTSDGYLVNKLKYSKPVINEPTATVGCGYSGISLSVDDNYSTYQWYYNGSAIYGATYPNFYASASNKGTGSYSVKVTTELDPSNEVSSASVDLTFYANPSINVKDYASQCFGETITLQVKDGNYNVGGYDTYQWYMSDEQYGVYTEIEGATSEEFDILVTAAPIYYKVEVTANEGNCVLNKSGYKIESTKASVNGVFDEVNSQLTLSTGSWYSDYQWQVSSTVQSDWEDLVDGTTNEVTVDILEDEQIYRVIISDYSCANSPSANYYVSSALYTQPTIKTPSTTVLCAGDNVMLEVESGNFDNYKWYIDGVYYGQGSTFTIYDYYASGTVTVKGITDVNVEIESEGIDIIVNSRPQISLSDAEAKFCPGGSIELITGDSYDSYKWYVWNEYDFGNAIIVDGETTSSLTVDIDDTDTYYYWVEVTAGECSSVSYAYSVTPLTINTPTISADNNQICIGEEVKLDVWGSDVDVQWYKNDDLIEGATANAYTTADVGYYDVEFTSKLCPNIEPVMSTDSLVVSYKYNLSFTVTPEGDIWDDNPNHRIFCGGDTITMDVDNATDYTFMQWQGKLYDVNSTSDEWENLEGKQDSVLTFINGENNKLRYRVEADVFEATEDVCAVISDYKIIDQHVNQSPAIASYDNSELCQAGDSTLLHLAFPGDWDHFEWYLDGELVPNTNTDTIYAKEEGMWTITCYPNTCPNIPHSSGIGPTVKIMPDAEIWENDTLIYAMPLYGFYEFQWYLNDEPVDESVLYSPWIILKEDLEVGSYTVKVTNSTDCERVSEPYVIEKIKEDQTITFDSIDAKVYSDMSFELAATASSGLVVTYDIVNDAVATVEGNVVTIIGVGTAKITAMQAGNEDYNAAAVVNRYIVVTKADQTIAFDAIPTKHILDEPFELTATASSGLEVSYVSSDEAVVELSGNKVMIVGVGTATITASQAGNNNYNAAVSVDQEITVVTDTTGVNLENSHMFEVYPNPTNDKLMVKLANSPDVENIQIFNAIGKIVKQYAVVSDLTIVSLDNEEAGIYLVKINYSDHTSAMQSVVKN